MSGETNFYNITINSGAGVTLTTDNIMRIAKTLVNSGSLDATEFPNTVEYSGDDQTIINPNGATTGYYHLMLTGSGTKTLPATALSVAGNFTMSGTAVATAGATMTIGGNLTIEDGATFITGVFNHTIGGNFSNDGTFTASAGYTITMNGASAQSMTGTVTTNFANLTIDNSHGVTLLTNENINNVLILTTGNLIVGETILGINGTISKTAGFLDVNALSSLSFGGTTAMTITSDLFTTPPSINNLTISRSGGVTLGNQNMTINGVLNLMAGTLSLGANTLTIAGISPTRTSGNIDASNTSATLAFTNPAAIILPASIFTGYVNNLTVNGTGGITASSDFILNGILYLQSENPSATKGSLDMLDGSTIKTLTMGASATTIGSGDVTGIIKRATIIAEVTYTFGNEYTTAYFPNIGTMPDEMSAKISIGTVPSWSSGAIAREIQVIQTGGSGTTATFSIHYLDAELNGNIEENLVLWVGPVPNVPYGRSYYNSSDNWVALTNINVGNYFTSSWDPNKNITLDESGTASTLTWNGSLSDSWTSVENWTPNAGPSSDKNIIIPDASTTLYSPTLPIATAIKTLTIQAAGILNSVAGAQLTINGGSSAWNNVGGTFNPGTSKVIFTGTDATISGTTNFYDVTTTATKVLWLTTGSAMRIAGTMTNNGTWRTVIGGPTVVEYNGGSQTVVVPNPATNRYSTLILSGSGTKTMPASALSIEGDFSMAGTASATAGAAMTLGGNVTIGPGTTLNLGAFSHTISGNLTNNGGTLTSSNSSITFNGNSLQTITSSPGITLDDLTISNTNADVILGASTGCSIGGDLAIFAGAVFDLSANVLTDVAGSISNSGTIMTQNTSVTPVPAGKTWGGTFEYTGSAAQTVVAGTYNNLTMSGSGGATAVADITVNGILNLSSVNPSGTKGILDMGTYTLLMGGAATTTGPGDVTGIVRRTSIVAGTVYSFGNEFTTLTFPVVTGQILPSEASLKINIGTAPTWKPGAIKRIYDFIQTGGSGTHAVLNAHYLDSELNANNENTLVDWSYRTIGTVLTEHGRSNYNTTDNWVGIANANVGFFSSSFGDVELTLDGSELTTLTWNGSESTSWTTANNWTPAGGPSDNTIIIIPDAATTPNDPIAHDGATCGTLTIQTGGILNTAANAQVTVNDASGAWSNQGGTFNAGSSTVIFTDENATMNGTTFFNNVTVNSGAVLSLDLNTVMGIEGTITNNGTWKPVFAGATTVIYNGAGQTVINPNGSTPGYYNLILSGSGTKTMPGTALAIYGDFTMSGTVSATAGAAIAATGNFTLGSGTTFDAAGLSHSIGGNFENNGATFNTAGSTFTFNGTAAQSIGGSASSIFNNLTLDNTNGVSLLHSETINGTLDFINGKISLGSSDLLLGSSATISNNTSTKYVVTNGTGALSQNVSASATKIYPVGLASEYLPITVQLSALSTADDIKVRVAYDLSTAYDANDAATGTPITNRVVLPAWFLKESVAGGTNATVTVQWNASDEAANFHRTWCNVAHYTSGSWHYSTSSAASGSAPYTQTVSGITSFSPFGVFGQSITCSFTGTTFFEGDALSVDYIASGGTWNSGNVFTAQLSDASGSFASPVAIGTINSQVSGTISATIPSGTLEGTAYRIRIVSSNPSGSGDNNGTDLTIHQLRSISGNINYYNIMNTPLVPVSPKVITVKLYQGESQVGSDYSATGGTYSFTNLYPGDYEVRISSDMSTVGSINTTDAAQANYWFTHKYAIEKVRYFAGDVTRNNVINSTDALGIQLNFVNGGTFERPNWSFWNVNESTITDCSEFYPQVTLVAGTDKVANMYGLCTGDFNRSFDPSGTKSASSTLDLIYAGNRQVSNNQEFDLPISMVNGCMVGAVSLILNFPDEMVEVQDVIMNGAGGQLDWAVAGGNELRIGWSSPVPLNLSAGAELVTLRLKTTAAFTTGNPIRIALADNPLNELADNMYEIIGNAVLSVNAIEASAFGIGEQPVANQISMSNYPNPFSNYTTISYTLPFEGKVTLEITSTLGNIITMLVSETQTVGNHEVKFNTHGLPTGVYFTTLRLISPNNKVIRTIKLLNSK